MVVVRKHIIRTDPILYTVTLFTNNLLFLFFFCAVVVVVVVIVSPSLL